MGHDAPHEFPVRMEDSGNRMMKRLFTFAILVLMLAVFSGTAGAEHPVPATPTDLACAHEHTRTTIYFYDSPAYAPVGTDAHRVFGPADVETVCLDCGEVLSLLKMNNAEEIRPHSMKKGVCALCGYREPVLTNEHRRADRAGEQTIIAREDGSVSGLLTVTLSEEELSAMSGAGVSTVLIRGRNGSAEISLDVRDALAQTEAGGLDLFVEFEEQPDGSFFAGLYLVTASGERIRVENEGITLRFYQEDREGNRVSVAPADTDTLVETKSVWDERGFWSVPYLEEGTYFILQ